MFSRALGVFAGLFLLGLVGAGSAQAQDKSGQGWSICNRTSFVIETSVARYEGQGVVVEGWKRLRPGSCEVALAGSLRPGVHYLFARSSTAHRGGRRIWGGDTPLCVDTTGSFSVESPQDCAAMGLESRDFRPVLIENRDTWKTSLTEIEEYSLEQAGNAGIQRLLADAGVFNGNIDGAIGRKTRAAINDFLTNNDLDQEMSDPDLIDILEQIAQDRGRNIGMTLCNRTRNRIWASIARRRGEGWESRGWWQLESGGCARVIDEPLLTAEHFVYAEMEDGGQTRMLKDTTDPFCIGHMRFAITGRKDCEASAYETALFAATPQPENRRLLYEFFERDFKEPDS
ncbi:DUF1036 domain-containing protein [Henriciella aquimarina]|uniref:DUF1036 domain-containing protein n=1 Tax=Henriciella aquimarina TaxID=545261 RepID=UPI001F1C1BC0|nr:DUF1036 domain-containing protein [Henriciella aquimarina]